MHDNFNIPPEHTRKIFNLQAGKQRREAGIAKAVKPRNPLLAQVQAHLRELAATRPDRCATADDASQYLVGLGLNASALGPAAGALFKGGNWQDTGRMVLSEKTANNARRLIVWALA